MDEIKKYLTEESAIHFTDGTVFKGSEDVSKAIFGMCESYKKGYEESIKSVALYAIVGIVVTVAGVQLSKMIKDKLKRN
jgi:hypothetical protein